MTKSRHAIALDEFKKLLTATDEFTDTDDILLCVANKEGFYISFHMSDWILFQAKPFSTPVPLVSGSVFEITDIVPRVLKVVKQATQTADVRYIAQGPCAVVLTPFVLDWPPKYLQLFCAISGLITAFANTGINGSNLEMSVSMLLSEVYDEVALEQAVEICTDHADCNKNVFPATGVRTEYIGEHTLKVFPMNKCSVNPYSLGLVLKKVIDYAHNELSHELRASCTWRYRHNWVDSGDAMFVTHRNYTVTSLSNMVALFNAYSGDADYTSVPRNDLF